MRPFVIHKRTLYLGTAITALLFIGAVMIFLPKGISESPDGRDFVIRKGESLMSVAGRLSDNGFVYSGYVFLGYAFALGKADSIQAGSYSLPQTISIHELVTQFSGGFARSNDVRVTIPEGVNLAEIDGILSRVGLTKEGEFLRATGPDREGYLFPDTYRFDPEATVYEIIGKLEENFNTKTLELGIGRLSPRLKEIVILASMLEKEVRNEQDMRIVAGIIERRYKIGMPLQIDATVAYGACRPDFSNGRFCDVTKVNLVQHIRLDSDYNTYTRKGLPKGPIANPGLATLKAALHPQASAYLYYLHTRDGRIIYSKTGAEHEAARAKYILK